MKNIASSSELYETKICAKSQKCKKINSLNRESAHFSTDLLTEIVEKVTKIEKLTERGSGRFRPAIPGVHHLGSRPGTES
jgi:hypothetical protein